MVFFLFREASCRLLDSPRLHVDDNGVFLAVFQLTMQLTPGAPHAEARRCDVLAERTLHTTFQP